MEIRLETAPVAEIEADWLIVPVAEESALSGQFAELDAATGGSLTRLREAGDLTGKRDETLADYNASGLKAERLVFVGLGKPGKINVSR
ncbi:MAG: peptidase M17, partial [Planctomycetes bacterium]|nr:peptidase M17 [Planctomycetota bacterium]